MSYPRTHHLRMKPVFVDVEQDSTLIKQLFEQHQLPIPPHNPGDWVGIDLDTKQPITIPKIEDYQQLTHSPTPSTVKEEQ